MFLGSEVRSAMWTALVIKFHRVHVLTLEVVGYVALMAGVLVHVISDLALQ